MELFTREQYAQLLKNGAHPDQDHAPVVKLFTPDAGATWLISEIYPDQPDLAFGLCDLGMGFPELGDVYLPEIRALRGRLGLPVECDLDFEGLYPMSVYAQAARKAEMIVTDNTALRNAIIDIERAKKNPPRPRF